MSCLTFFPGIICTYPESVLMGMGAFLETLFVYMVPARNHSPLVCAIGSFVSDPLDSCGGLGFRPTLLCCCVGVLVCWCAGVAKLGGIMSAATRTGVLLFSLCRYTHPIFALSYHNLGPTGFVDMQEGRRHARTFAKPSFTPRFLAEILASHVSKERPEEV